MSPKGIGLLLFCILTFVATGVFSAEEPAPAPKAKDGKTLPPPPNGKKPANGENGNDEESGKEAFDDYMKLAEAFSSSTVEATEVFYYQCKNVRSQTMKRILEDFVSNRGTVSESEESDLIVVQDVKSNLEQIKDIAENVDRRVQQVLVRAQIVELTIERDYEKELSHAFEHLGTSGSFVNSLSVDLPTPGASANTGSGMTFNLTPWVESYSDGHSNKLMSTLRFLESRGKAKILSAPNLILQRGTDGNIITGEEVPITQQTVTSGSITSSTIFKRVGITLRVKPIMINEKTVRLSVMPEVSTVTGYTAADATGVSNPLIAVRSASTVLEVKDGELISIGGLMRSENRTTRSKVPILGSLPGVGHFFRSSRDESVKTQLVIFLTIDILGDSQPGAETVFRPDDIPEKVKSEMEEMEKAQMPDKADKNSELREDIENFMLDARQ